MKSSYGTYSAWVPPTGGASGGGSGAPSGVFAVTLDTNYLSAVQENGVGITLGAVTAFPVSGTEPYSYAWTRVSGATDITADTPSASSTSFTVIAGTDSVKTATFVCTVTDDTTASVDSPEVTVTVEFTSIGGDGGDGDGSYINP